MTYHLAYISTERPIISENHVSELLNIDNLEDAEKILAAEFHTLGAKNAKIILTMIKTHHLFEINI